METKKRFSFGEKIFSIKNKDNYKIVTILFCSITIRRGFYYPLENTPFPVATNNNELVANIENFDNEKYISLVEQFLKDKGCMEDGHASERVVDLIEKIMNNEE